MGNYDKIGGGYVHYNYNNYLKYGLNTSEEGNEINFSPALILNQQVEAFKKNKINRLKRPEVKDELEKRLNYFFKSNPVDAAGNSIDFGIKPQEKKEYEELMLQILEPVITKYRGNMGDVHMESLDYDYNASAQAVLTCFKRLAEQTDRNKIESIQNRIVELNNLVSTLFQQGQMATAQGIEDKIKIFEKNHQTIWNEINKNITPGSSQTAFNKNKNQYHNIQSQDSTFIKDLNDLVSAAKSVAVTTILKILGEDGVALFNTVIQKRVIGETHEQVKAFLNSLKNSFTNTKQGKEYKIGVVGMRTSMKMLNANNFAWANKKNTNSINEIYSTPSVKLTSTEDKVDVEFYLPGGRGRLVPASVKNVNLSIDRNINILSGTSFLKLLQDYGLFVNHYLNITGVNRDYPSSIGQRMALIQQANKIALLMMAFHGLVGNVFGKRGSATGYSESAQVFVVNDHTSKDGVKVYYMRDILDFFVNNINCIFDVIQLSGFDSDTVWSSAWAGEPFNNNYSDAYRRINTLLTQLNVAQYKMSIDPIVLSLI